jgi:KAP family P-loop domain
VSPKLSEQDAGSRGVLEYLHYYCAPDSKLDFAVMVRGKWGAGKTYLINQFLEARKAAGQPKNLYVSLYGLSSLRQVDEALYRQLHPMLSSKGMETCRHYWKGAFESEAWRTASMRKHAQS